MLRYTNIYRISMVLEAVGHPEDLSLVRFSGASAHSKTDTSGNVNTKLVIHHSGPWIILPNSLAQGLQKLPRTLPFHNSLVHQQLPLHSQNPLYIHTQHKQITNFTSQYHTLTHTTCLTHRTKNSKPPW
jgi:hypothetical protein